MANALLKAVIYWKLAVKHRNLCDMSRSRVKILCHCNRCRGQLLQPPHLIMIMRRQHHPVACTVNSVSRTGGADPSSDSGDESGVATGDDTYQQDLQDIADHSEASSEEEEESCTPASLRKKVWPRGVFTKAALLDMLAEQANFHNVSDVMMEGILDIINLLVLDGGATKPVMASWDAFRKMMDRRTAHKASLGALPAIYKHCREDIKLDEKTLPQYVLRHFNVVDQLKTILQLPAARKYVNINATRIQYLHVPADMKKCPAWQKYVHDPSEIVLYFDRVPAFRCIKYGTYTMHAVALEILNLPFYLRADPLYTIVSDLVPGPKSPKNFRPVFLPLTTKRKSNFSSTSFWEHLQQAGNVDVCLVGKKCREFVDFVLHGRRFTCAQGLNAQRSKDLSEFPEPVGALSVLESKP
eukprot:g74943.t1